MVCVVIVLFSAGVFIWNPRGTDPNETQPRLGPPPAARQASPPVAHSFGKSDSLPKELSDSAFWEMMSEFSEPDGYFMYENFHSNERSYQEPIRALKSTVRPGGVYLGVGPEQNFTYIAAIRPQMAFIIDIRRQNRIELLMYKMLFEMSRSRADFASMLFSRKRPDGLDEATSAEELFRSFADVPADSRTFDGNLKRIKERMASHGFELTPDDEKTLDHVYSVFFSAGPDLAYSSVSPGPSGPSYESLMTLTDRENHNWSYLASEANFEYVKEMERKNLIVPLVGDFAGPKTIRTVASYLRDQNATVGVFYVSNVEMYILASPRWRNFCGNVAALPMDTSSSFVRFVLPGYARTVAQQRYTPFTAISVISPMIDVLTGVVKGYPPSYYDLLRASR